MNRTQLLRIVILIIGFYLILTTVRAFGDFWNAGDKLTIRQKRLSVLQKQRQELLKRKSQVESQDYVEQVARNELGMAKVGEKVIIIPPNLLVEPTKEQIKVLPNWEKWRDLLF